MFTADRASKQEELSHRFQNNDFSRREHFPTFMQSVPCHTIACAQQSEGSRETPLDPARCLGSIKKVKLENDL